MGFGTGARRVWKMTRGTAHHMLCNCLIMLDSPRGKQALRMTRKSPSLKNAVVVKSHCKDHISRNIRPRAINTDESEIVTFVCNRGARLTRKYTLKIYAPHLLSGLHLISRVSCEARRRGRLHIAHFILTTGSRDEALREMDEEAVGDCILCVFPG